MSKSENQERMSRTDLEQVSTVGLEKLLLDDFYSSGDGEDNIGELYMAAQILGERRSIPCDCVDQAWERFRENYLPFAVMLDEDGGAPSSDDAQRRRHSPLHQWMVRVALAAVLLCTLVLSVSIAAAASGFDFLKALAQWTDEQIWLAPGQIDPASKDEIRIPEGSREYTSLQEAFEDCGFTQPVTPQWLPDDFRMKKVIFDDLTPENLLYQALYQRGEESIVMLVVIHLADEDSGNGGYINFEKDEGDPVPYEAGGITHLLSTNAGRPVAVWANGPAECAISGDMTMGDLEQMINSIYE